ncbi:MAG: hypothetical protein J6D37_03365 [Clostridia bacterium]|nr:hypothetical protein [Clostridia bacterium]
MKTKQPLKIFLCIVVVAILAFGVVQTILFVSALSKLTHPLLPDSSPVVIKVVTSSENSVRYWAVHETGRHEEIDAFEYDKPIVYRAKYGCFHSEIVNGKVQSFFDKADLIDENGNEIEETQTMIRIMQEAARITDHDIFAFSILQVGETYYVQIDLNVNWQSPCKLYRYEGELKHLGTWDSVTIIGIR